MYKNSFNKSNITYSVSLFFFSLCFFSCQQTSTNKEVLETNQLVKSNPTFEDIAPIIYKNCTPCHRPGESGPFELLTYDDAKRNANKIKFVTQTKYMPPWPAEPSYSHFIGERVLTENEILLIKNWADDGAKEGDKTKTVIAPSLENYNSEHEPDTVICFNKAIKLQGDGTDKFYIVKIPLQLAKDTFVKYFEFVPHQRKLIHHVNGHLINFDVGKKKNIRQGEPYLLDEYKDYKEAYLKLNVLNDDSSFPTLTPNTVYYLPGFTPPVYPKNIGGFKLNKNASVLLKSIHYGPSNTDVLDSSYINVYYCKKPERPVFESQLGTFGISKIEPELIIEPNKIQTFHTKALIDKDISLLSINPHMHLLGKSFWAFALKPNGDTIPLIKIKKWDFKWQYYYTFIHPIKIPANTTLYAFGIFDNTSNNPNNPNRPPKRVTQGDGVKSMKTTEEMFQFIFTYLPYKQGDERIDLKP